jgi:Na+/proline symporter
MKTKRRFNQQEFQKILSGLFLLLGIHLAIFIVLRILASIIITVNIEIAGRLILTLFYIGIWQLFYAIPLILWLKRTQQWGRMKGVIIGTVVTILTNISFLFSSITG